MWTLLFFICFVLFWVWLFSSNTDIEIGVVLLILMVLFGGAAVFTEPSIKLSDAKIQLIGITGDAQVQVTETGNQRTWFYRVTTKAGKEMTMACTPGTPPSCVLYEPVFSAQATEAPAPTIVPQ